MTIAVVKREVASIQQIPQYICFKENSGERLRATRPSCFILRVTGGIFLSLKINFVLEKCVDPDEIFHPGLHCLSKYRIGASGLQRINP